MHDLDPDAAYLDRTSAFLLLVVPRHRVCDAPFTLTRVRTTEPDPRCGRTGAPGAVACGAHGNRAAAAGRRESRRGGVRRDLAAGGGRRRHRTGGGSAAGGNRNERGQQESSTAHGSQGPAMRNASPSPANTDALSVSVRSPFAPGTPQSPASPHPVDRRTRCDRRPARSSGARVRRVRSIPSLLRGGSNRARAT